MDIYLLAVVIANGTLYKYRNFTYIYYQYINIYNLINNNENKRGYNTRILYKVIW